MEEKDVLRQTIPKVQATEVTYELHSLGWKAFQNLCVTIVADVWGQVVQSFFDSRDGGRDGAFRGSWKRKGGESFQGSFTVQCKFTAKADKTLQSSDLNDELKKAYRLASQGLADNYFLFTNAHITGVTEEKITRCYEAIPGIKRFAAYGRDRISQIIRESPRLRMLVPRVYGLGDLSQILDERAYAQAREVLSSLGDDLAKFVITDAYSKSAKALVNHGFVLLLGEPASGKSTIAAALSMGALDEWGCSTVKARDADEFVKHSNPNEPKQFFWVDDVFGTTQLDSSCVSAWNRVFPHLQAAIRRGARVLFTSRDYIYRSARQYLKETAFPLVKESQVVIHVERLSKEEREQILYNHVRLGTQPKEFKRQVKIFLPTVSAHSRFSPEIARRLGNPIFTKQLVISTSGLDDFVAHPSEFLCEIIRTLRESFGNCFGVHAGGDTGKSGPNDR
jgi:energy-coupling factor transporter ATP-binding protein EcfA2